MASAHHQDSDSSSSDEDDESSHSEYESAEEDSHPIAIADDEPPITSYRSTYPHDQWSGSHAPRLLATSREKRAHRALRSYSLYIDPQYLRPDQLVTAEEKALRSREHKIEESDKPPGDDPVERRFPTTRRLIRKQPTPASVISDEDLQKWWDTEGPTFGILAPHHLRMQHMRFWHAYKDCGAKSTTEMSVPTDLYVHKVRLKHGAKPWNRSRRRAWSNAQLYWLKELATQCLNSGMYEPTVTANGELSAWTAQPVLVNKDRYDKVSIPGDDPDVEPRLTVNYSNVDEELPGTHLPLLAEVHERLPQATAGPTFNR
ncbi:hypothetical protein GGR50DRAFT_699090 [Xylaria sp. CBS 124048]|nr:hypothetical protein GGR50DRAFT_699090 [Xylaria sp. CBS 124048]